MKAVILAAGMGVRLGKYTAGLPKGMLNFAGKTLIERQIDTFRKAGVGDIIIVTGYNAEKIPYKGVRYCHNPNYESTNMVESLFCAEAENRLIDHRQIGSMSSKIKLSFYLQLSK